MDFRLDSFGKSVGDTIVYVVDKHYKPFPQLTFSSTHLRFTSLHGLYVPTYDVMFRQSSKSITVLHSKGVFERFGSTKLRLHRRGGSKVTFETLMMCLSSLTPPSWSTKQKIPGVLQHHDSHPHRVPTFGPSDQVSYVGKQLLDAILAVNDDRIVRHRGTAHFTRQLCMHSDGIDLSRGLIGQWREHPRSRFERLRWRIILDSHSKCVDEDAKEALITPEALHVMTKILGVFEHAAHRTAPERTFRDGQRLLPDKIHKTHRLPIGRDLVEYRRGISRIQQRPSRQYKSSRNHNGVHHTMRTEALIRTEIIMGLAQGEIKFSPNGSFSFILDPKGVPSRKTSKPVYL